MALVATGASPGLPVADCGIGLCRRGEPAPWGAHVVAQEDLTDVRFLIEACVSARRLAKQSVNIALGAATVGAFVSAGGLLPMTSRRVLFVVNAATLLSMANGARGSYQLARKALPPPRDPTPWHALDAEGRAGAPRCDRPWPSGARTSRLRAREAPSPQWAITQFRERGPGTKFFNPLSPLLAAGAGLSAVVGSVADAGMVAGVVGLNALVGGAQRFRTERAVRKLARETRRRALVVREGETRDVDATEPGAGRHRRSASR